jgi:transposase
MGSFRPERGRYSRRANAKRSFWLRGKIFRFSRYKAWNAGIVTCRVNPKNTSRQCARCGAQVARYGSGEPHEGYRPGAPLIWCPVCLLEGNADFNASRNITQRLVVRCHQTMQQTLQEKPPTGSLADEVSKDTGGRVPHEAAGHGHATGHGTA